MDTHAIVRTPGSNFADGLTSGLCGAPRYDLVLQQHACYCEALRQCGLALTTLDPDLAHPDSTFVEDTAVLTARAAMLTRPGAVSRVGEVAAIRPAILRFFQEAQQITAPGTVDGGDICEAGNHFFLGLSHRSNQAGLRQLSLFLSHQGYSSSLVDIRGIPGILHLKSGISYIGNNTLVIQQEMTNHQPFRDYRRIQVADQESYAANCVRVNDRVLVADGFPRLAQDLGRLGFNPLALPMSEFQKMDGGLSCLSLRF